MTIKIHPLASFIRLSVFEFQKNSYYVRNRFRLKTLLLVIHEQLANLSSSFYCLTRRMGSSFTGDKVVQDSNMGLYYMAALDIFQCLEDPEYSHLTVGVSLFEIYSGKLFDLLNNRRAVKCLEDHQGKVQFPGLSEHEIFGPPELIELIELGAESRSTGTTSRNADSSRSHAVLQLHLRKTVGRKTNVEHGKSRVLHCHFCSTQKRKTMY